MKAYQTYRAVRASILNQDMSRAGFYIFLSLVTLLGYLMLVKLVGLIAVPVLVIITGAAIYLSAEFSLAFLLTAIFIQNCLVSLLIEYGHGFKEQFNIMLASSFVITTLMAGACFITWVRSRRALASDNREILRWTIFFSLIVVVYSFLGLINADLKSVLIYDRVYLSGAMFLSIGVITGTKLSSSYFINLIRAFSFILIIWGVTEFFFQKQIFELFNVIEYLNMKYIDFRPETVSIDELVGSRGYLNLSGPYSLKFQAVRSNGPNIHPISFGYELCFCCLMGLMCRHYIMAALCFTVMLSVGVKGALVLALFSSFLFLLYKIVGSRPFIIVMTMVALALVYMTGVIIYGKITSDYHILGLIGSIKGFLSNPFGHGVGVGGNMSALGKLNNGRAAFMRYQRLGETDVALESAFGVMLYQLGVWALVFLLYYRLIWRKMWSIAISFNKKSSLVLIPFGLFFILINSVFQEEALSPAGWGLWLLAGGVYLGQKWGQGEANVTACR